MVRYRRPNKPFEDPLTPEGRKLIAEAKLGLLASWDKALSPLEYFEAESKFTRTFEYVRKHHFRQH